jgi:hypothetical protein
LIDSFAAPENPIFAESIELLAEDVRLEQAPIGGEELLQLLALRTTHRFPAQEQQPAFPAAVLAHQRPRAKELRRRTSSSAAEACCNT